MMKTRLYGLLALVLCAMMVAAPVAAMGTSGEGPFVTFESGEQIVEGMLICTSYPNTSGNRLTINWHSNDNSGYSYTPATFGTLKQNEAWKVTEIAFTPSNAPTDAHIYVSRVNIIAIEQYNDVAAEGKEFDCFITTTLGKYRTSQETHDQVLKLLRDTLENEGYSANNYYEIGGYETHNNGQFYSPVDVDFGTEEKSFSLPVSAANLNITENMVYAVAHGYTEYAMSQDGWVAYLAAEFIKDTDPDTDGVQFAVDSLSPFAVGFDPDPDDDDTTSSGGGGNGGGGNINPGNGGNDGGTTNPGGPGDRIPAPADPAAPSAPSIPQTGDNSQLALWFALAALSLTGAVLALRRRKA